MITKLTPEERKKDIIRLLWEMESILLSEDGVYYYNILHSLRDLYHERSESRTSGRLEATSRSTDEGSKED